MSTPLRKSSGRLQTPQHILSTPREMTATKNRAAGDNQTESVNSDSPNPSSSGDFSPTLRVQLKAAFPSIYTSINLMKRHHEAKDIPALRTISLVFLTTYRTAIAETSKMQGLEPTDIDLHICRASAVSIGKLFESHINNLEKLLLIDSEALTAAFRFAQMALSTLEHLHQFTVLTSRDKKALPAIPDEEDEDAGSVYYDAVSDVQSHNPMSGVSPPPYSRPPSIVASTSLGSSSSGTKVDSEATASTLNEFSPMSFTIQELDEDIDTISSLPSKGGLAHRLKQKVAHSKVSIFNNKNKSTVTLSEPPKQSIIPSYMMEDEECIEDDFVITRRSTIYFPNDPRLENGKLPDIRPTSMAGSIRFDSKGKIRAGTLGALIRVLSSSEGITNVDLLNTVMSNFRMFSTPREFFSQLLHRYDERPPHAFDAAGAERWEREFRAVRVRVVKILVFWLKEHWNQESDISTLPDITAFVEYRARHVIPDSLMAILREQITEKGIPASRQPATPSKKVGVHSPIKSKFSINKETCNLSVQLLAYNSSSGRVEFARQVTAKVSEMYTRVQPSTMVQYWSLKPEKKKALEKQDNLDAAFRLVLDIRDFEEALVMWVSFTVVKQYDRQQRIDFITFWLDIALQCLEMRNFSSACCIFTGVAHYSVGAMKTTVLHVPRRVKARFHKLERFFSGHGNYGQARSAMDGSNGATQPMVPLSAPLRHDMGVCQEIPKTLSHTKNGEDVELINLQGYEIMTKTIKSLSYRVPYNITQNQDFQEWLDSQLSRFSDNSQIEDLYQSLFRRARKREPKDASLNGINDPWRYIVEGNQYIGPLDSATLAASASSGNAGKAKSILQSLRSRGTRDKK